MRLSSTSCSFSDELKSDSSAGESMVASSLPFHDAPSSSLLPSSGSSGGPGSEKYVNPGDLRGLLAALETSGVKIDSQYMAESDGKMSPLYDPDITALRSTSHIL